MNLKLRGIGMVRGHAQRHRARFLGDSQIAEGASNPLFVIRQLTFSQGAIDMIFFIAVLSINLGLVNLLPIPILDGGHLLLYCIEAVTGKPVGERATEISFRIGLAFIFSLMILVTWNDLVQIWSK